MNKKVKFSGLWTAILSVVSVAYIFPILLVLINSFKKKAYISRYPFAIPTDKMFVGLEKLLCYVMGYVLMAFKKDDIPKRMQASAVSARRQSLEGLLAMFIMGGGLWGIGMAGAILMYGKTFLSSENFGYYVLNTLVMMAVALSLSYLIGLFVKNSNMLSGIANILSLGMCFLCGVFVPMNIMDRNVLKVSQFLPVYWYENVNETLGSYSHLTGEAAVSVWKGIGLEVMFAVVFVCMILAVTRYQRQK